MNPYSRFVAAGHEDQRRFFEELGHWHDEMVLHQRSVRRLGPSVACSDTCPHVEGRRLWKEAKSLLGPGANALTFLRTCAGEPDLVPPPAPPASAPRTTAA